MHQQDRTNTDRAVTPVIGIILLVAITVILASVIAVFVLGFGGEETVTPNPSFETNYYEDELTIEIRGGDGFAADQVEVVFEDEGDEVEAYWYEFTDETDADSDVRVSDEIVIGSSDGSVANFPVDRTTWDVEIYWEDENGDNRERIFQDNA